MVDPAASTRHCAVTGRNKTNENEIVRDINTDVFWNMQKTHSFCYPPEAKVIQKPCAGELGAGSASWREPPKATCKGPLRNPNINAWNDYRFKLISDYCHKALQWFRIWFGTLCRSKRSDFITGILNKCTYQETRFQNHSTAALWQLLRLFWPPRQSEKAQSNPQNTMVRVQNTINNIGF